jgi:zinc protease
MSPAAHQFTLDNGLRVILQETHTAPVVSTWLWYRVGSRNEIEGCTGLSHWVEHMMFKGSPSFAKGSIMREVNRFGGHVNAMTSNDFTAYYTTLPSDQSELALRIEADRLRSAFFVPEEVESERTVIIAEREGSENEPSYMLAEEVMASAFRLHPYHHQTVGWKEDLQTIGRDQLYAHYQSYYVPNNAVLVVVGDFEPVAQRALIERHLGGIPAGPQPELRVRQEPAQRGERRVKLHMPGSAPNIRICYHTPPVSHPDYMPLVVLDAVLSGGKAMFAFGNSQARSARLYRALVETQLASSVGSHYHPSLDPYVLTFGATVRDGRQPEEVEQALLAEAERLVTQPVEPRELHVAIRQAQAQFAYSSESVTDQALTLGFLEIVDRHERMPHILDELRAVTPDEVLRVAQTYLVETNRTVGWFVPTGGGQEDQEPQPSQALWRSPREGRCYLTPPPAPVALSNISPDTVRRTRLENGVTVLIQENPASASVYLEGYLDAGTLHDATDGPGRATMMAAMLRRGTQRHSFAELNECLDGTGASLGTNAGRDDLGIWGQALAEDVDLLLDLLTEMLTAPAFAHEELDKLRGQYLTHLGMLQTDTGYRADRAFMETLYPDGHPYGRTTLGTRESLGALTRDDLVAYYAQQVHPSSLVLCLVGAIDPDRVLARLASTLGSWSPTGQPRACLVPPAAAPLGAVERRVQLPEKSQVDLILGTVGMDRRSPDYYAGMMADVVLGQLGMMGRLGASVRDEQGLAYYVSSNLRAGNGPYPWSIVAGVASGNVEAAVAGILAEINRLRDRPVSDEELADCRSYLTGSLPLRLETNEGIASFLLNIAEYDLGWDYLQRYPGIIQAVTPEEMQQVVQRYLFPDRYVLALAGTLQ